MDKFISILIFFLTLTHCSSDGWNQPHQKNTANKTIYYSSFSEQPKTLDPARSYTTSESIFVSQIYEPPLQYDYLSKGYKLIPLTAASMPAPIYYDKIGKVIPENYPAEQVDHSVYTINIQPNIYYQPHPAFAKNAEGKLLYDQLTAADVADINTPNDFKQLSTRELTAADYVYEIKRLASPKVQSPIMGVMSDYILGFTEFNQALQKQAQSSNYLDLNQFDLAGAKVIDRYTYQITVKGKYPQFIYWLAMPFFAPIPWEADKFYSQPILKKQNITFDTFPVGTGPYMLQQNNPNREIILVKNPNFHLEYYPGTKEKLPFIDEFYFSLEKESIPRWAKFLQGYYDASPISSDNFDQVVMVDENNLPHLTDAMQKMHLKLRTTVSPGVFYLGFNMLDPVVGGYTEKKQKLRQAISIALNFEEYIAIFLNGQGKPAQEPIPPGIFGYLPGKEGIDPYTYNWENNKAQRKSLLEARKLLAEAGYPNGIDPTTGKPLVLYFDSPVEAGPDSSALFAWLRKQFSNLGIQLVVRATEYNRFQEKMRTGNAQLYMWGWQADYPDPENFLFLLYGPNGKVKSGGENAANYQNQEFDALFAAMKNLPNGPERQAVINKMLAIAQRDAPWAWGYFPTSFGLTQEWVSNYYPNAMANNIFKYLKLNKTLQSERQKEWNKPSLWPLALLGLLLILIITPVIFSYFHKQYTKTKKEL